jgi:hypothetical protein
VTGQTNVPGKHAPRHRSGVRRPDEAGMHSGPDPQELLPVVILRHRELHRLGRNPALIEPGTPPSGEDANIGLV